MSYIQIQGDNTELPFYEITHKKDSSSSEDNTDSDDSSSSASSSSLDDVDILEKARNSNINNRKSLLVEEEERKRKKKQSVIKQKTNTKQTEKQMPKATEYLIKLLTRDPKTRSKEDLKILMGFLFDYFRKVLFNSDKETQNKNYSDAVIEQIVMDLFRTTVRLQTFQFGEIVANYNQPLDFIGMVLRGNCIVKIPYDKVSKTMTIKEYFRYIYCLSAQATVELDGQYSVNRCIITDYNCNHPKVIEIQEKKKELEQEKLKAMKDPQLAKMFSESGVITQEVVMETNTVIADST